MSRARRPGPTGQEERFRRLYADESAVRLVRLDRATRLLASGGGATVGGRSGRTDAGAVLDEMLRDAHTLKGGAAVVGLGHVRRVAAALEHTLEELRAGRRAVTVDLAERLLRAVHGLRGLIAAGVRGEEHAGDADAVLATLDETRE